jgi:hypothetical protein
MSGPTRGSGGGNNMERLQAAGVLNPDFPFTKEEISAIEKLTDAEVKQLIRIREKVGDFSHVRRGGCGIIL